MEGVLLLFLLGFIATIPVIEDHADEDEPASPTGPPEPEIAPTPAPPEGDPTDEQDLVKFGGPEDDKFTVEIIAPRDAAQPEHGHEIAMIGQSGDDILAGYIYAADTTPDAPNTGGPQKAALPLTPHQVFVEAGPGKDFVQLELREAHPTQRGLLEGEIYGGSGKDRITAHGELHAFGGSGDDRLDGQGFAQLFGGDGDDRLSATWEPIYNGAFLDLSAENVHMTGGDGADIFVTGWGIVNTSRTVTLTDFDNETDRIEIERIPLEVLTSLNIVETESGTTITALFALDPAFIEKGLEPGDYLWEYPEWRNSVDDPPRASVIVLPHCFNFNQDLLSVG